MTCSPPALASPYPIQNTRLGGNGGPWDLPDEPEGTRSRLCKQWIYEAVLEFARHRAEFRSKSLTSNLGRCDYGASLSALINLLAPVSDPFAASLWPCGGKCFEKIKPTEARDKISACRGGYALGWSLKNLRPCLRSIGSFGEIMGATPP